MATGDSALDGPLAAGQVEATEVTAEGVVVAKVQVHVDENSPRAPVFSALGAGGRPLPRGTDGAAEVIAARVSDGLAVMALRDLRIETAREEEPAEGTVYFAGYHGAELRFDVVDGEERSTVTLTEAHGVELVLDEEGVRAPTSPLVQGDPDNAEDVALAAPAVALLKQLGPIALKLAAAVNALAPGTITPQEITDLTTALAPYLVPAAGAAPEAPATRAPDLRGAPGA